MALPPSLTSPLPQDNIPESTLKKLKKYIDNPKFLPEIVEKTSKVRAIGLDHRRVVISWFAGVQVHVPVGTCHRPVCPRSQDCGAQERKVNFKGESLGVLSW